MADLLLRPVMLASIALLVLNDHWLKWRWPGWATGKLSDAAGLSFFPVFLAILASPLVPPRRGSAPLVAACAALTAAVFSAVKCWPAATGWYRVGLGALQWALRQPWLLLTGQPPGSPRPVEAVTDPTDLLALPFVLVAVSVAVRADREASV